MATNEAVAVGSIMAIVIIIAALFCFALMAATYIMNAIALMKMAKKCGIKNAWLAWIPFANSYILGKISETPDKPRKTGVALLILHIALSLIAAPFGGIYGLMVSQMMTEIISTGDMTGSFGILDESALMGLSIALFVTAVLMMAVSIAYSVIYYIAFYRITKLFGGAKQMTYFLLGLILTLLGIPLALNIVMLILAGKQPDPTPFLPPQYYAPADEPEQSAE